jgi:DNA-binding NarL/FixJ family response regulator
MMTEWTDPATSDLTSEETRVVQLAASRRSNEQIAETLGVTIDELVEQFRLLLWKLQVRPGAPQSGNEPPARLQGCRH